MGGSNSKAPYTPPPLYVEHLFCWGTHPTAALPVRVPNLLWQFAALIADKRAFCCMFYDLSHHDDRTIDVA